MCRTYTVSVSYYSPVLIHAVVAVIIARPMGLWDGSHWLEGAVSARLGEPNEQLCYMP